MEKYFLRKRNNDYWLESKTKNSAAVIAEINPEDDLTLKLSLKNCQSIERGFDLDEIVEQTKNTLEDCRISSYESFKIGFQKAVELVSNKKYSEQQILKAFIKGVFSEEDCDHDSEFKKLIESLQVEEWEVEIVKEESKDTFGNAEFTWYNSKLDENGCLILKRV